MDTAGKIEVAEDDACGGILLEMEALTMNEEWNEVLRDLHRQRTEVRAAREVLTAKSADVTFVEELKNRPLGHTAGGLNHIQQLLDIANDHARLADNNLRTLITNYNASLTAFNNAEHRMTAASVFQLEPLPNNGLQATTGHIV